MRLNLGCKNKIHRTVYAKDETGLSVRFHELKKPEDYTTDVLKERTSSFIKASKAYKCVVYFA